MLGGTTELTRGRLLARNVGLNVAGWAVPAACALVAIPALVRTVGAERFGLLALAWTLVGAFSPFDLGIGRALTQALAERVGRAAQDDSPSVTWTALWLLLVVGMASAAGLVAAAPAAAARWLHVSPALQPEAEQALRWLAVAVPITTVTAGLRGVLEAGQAFRTVNALRVPLALLSFLGPLAVQPWTHALPAAVAVLVGSRVLVGVLHAASVLRRYPALRRPRAPDVAALGALWRVAGWMTLSTLSGPLLVTGDRFVIGAALPLAALAQYAAVSELASKLGVVGGMLQPVLLPALAATLVADRARAVALFDRGVRVVALAVAPATLAVVALAPEGLAVWLGPALAADAAPVLQLLAIASYVNVFAQLPYVTLHAAGRADLPAKFHCLEVPLHLTLLAVLVPRHGLLGAAVAGGVRILLDTALLFVAVPRVLGDARSELRRATLLATVGACVLGACALVGPLSGRLTVATLAAVAFAWVAVRWLVTPGERAQVREWRRRRAAARTPSASAA